MAASLFFMATDESPAAAKEPPETHFSSGEIQTEPVKKKGRKPNSRAQTQKKQPQRGMGVAKLEILRLHQEQWMKMAETANPTRLPLTDTVGTDTVLHGVPKYGAPAICSGGSKMGLNTGPVIQSVKESCSVCGFGSGVGCDQIVCPVRVCLPETRLKTWGFVETSIELSSMPKSQQCASDRFDVCFKKKPSHGDRLQSNGGASEKCLKMSRINGCDFPTFNRDKNPTSGYDNYFTGTPINALNYSDHQYLNEVLESYMERNPKYGGPIFKEYEFFPGKDGLSTFSNERQPSVPVSGVEGEASCVITTACSPNPSNTIDLSLKL